MNNQWHHLKNAQKREVEQISNDLVDPNTALQKEAKRSGVLKLVHPAIVTPLQQSSGLALSVIKECETLLAR